MILFITPGLKMKSLIILGVPRAGKSTLAKYVVKQLVQDGVPVTLLSADSLIGGLTAKR
ncbi:MAG: adenylyl-sulfate kinase, partial [Alphaproteobacteria bacterium]|nr:adenylyl-sulfate kinase [Alphaproteobacteria bacterium]